MASSTVGPWAKDKLDRLGKYLNAYTTIMRKQSWCEGYYYIDAFAGPGKHQVRDKEVNELEVESALLDLSHDGSQQPEHQAFLAGSPRIALELNNPFSGYIFVEKNAERATELEQLKEEFGTSRSISIHKLDCNEFLLNRVVNSKKVNWKTNRAVVFLDPFGMQVGWDTLQNLAQTEAIEVFLNFPVGMAIQRLLPRDSTKLTKKSREKLDRYFGSPDWYRELYKPQFNLFGEEIDENSENSGIALLRWYRARLKKAFGHVSKAALIRNSKGGHLYFLLLATPKATGAKIASDILSGGETVRL
ncbi:Ribosomal RNA large subunit methyltransferase J [Symmachiella dynata]|uniref:three-Cys-motif partner protein TcmP n=1 Tax=Symmachiella dynata TaxID=2527995 RepID=UPI00118B68E6|nr:three-Cys-motif partner protein TcmP [Symmachiella dynata]QDT46454.1 Ribosomal RNA large subunit methyltransferase J [Symmachiella dynata]